MNRKYHQRIVATHILFVNEGKVLLSVRANTGYRDGWYSVVGGHVEDNEYLIDATIREAEEEVGVKIKEKDLKLN